MTLDGKIKLDIQNITIRVITTLINIIFPAMESNLPFQFANFFVIFLMSIF